jgi:hypothetical protein
MNIGFTAKQLNGVLVKLISLYGFLIMIFQTSQGKVTLNILGPGSEIVTIT